MNRAAKMRTVGVLGGMGPEATVLLMSRVIALTAATDDSDHVPMLIDNNTQVPSRIKALIEKTGEDPGPVLVAMARRLAAAGAEALAMPCNTAHHYAPLLKRSLSLPFLDMIELTTDHLRGLPAAAGSSDCLRVGMLASPAVKITGLFDRAFAGHRLQPVYLPDQNALLACIREIKSAGQSDAAVQLLQDAAAGLLQAGVDVLLVACSELSLLNRRLPREVLMVDSIDVLAGAIVAFSRDGLARNG